jgi:hypothetical protein
MSIAETARISHRSFGDLLIEAVYVLILMVTVGGWTVVGFLVWVPLLIRTTTLLAAVVFYSTLFRDQPRVTRAEQSLHFAVRFYLRGFEHVINFYRHRHAEEAPSGLLEPLSEMRWKEMIVQCLWVVGAWAIVYFSFHSLLARLLSAN